jgi:hypothetical protein
MRCAPFRFSGATTGQNESLSMKTIPKIIMAGALVLALTINTFAQNTLQFTSVNATPENAIQLHWASNTNEVYKVDYADALIDTNTGSIIWNKLYDDYPAHQGSNTFYLDTGDYDNSSPPIPHPKDSPMRFYRIVMTGTNTGSNPTVAITSPTNGDVISANFTVTVNASSDQMLVDTILYVDGQEMPPSNDGTNFVINTCEWWNGAHTLFAVAKSQSSLEGLLNNSAITYGRWVSAYVTVTFSNLISEFAFSQPFFEPALGQTQAVTAMFAVNCDWTLQIQDVNSNTVRTATGSGTSMEFDWDGTGDGETNIPDGVYNYLLSVETDSESGNAMMSRSGGRFSSLSSASVVDDSPELWAMSAEGDDAVPLALYPPGMDTNSLTIISATRSEIQTARLPATSSFARSASFKTQEASPSYSGPSSQSTLGPTRPPTNPVKGHVGTFGVAYQSYANGFTIHAPTSGWPFPLPVYVQLENYPYGSQFTLDPVKEFKSLANHFSSAMQHNGWKLGFILADDELTEEDIEKTSLGGNSIFNSVDIGLLMGHGSYGKTSEDDNVKYSYFFLGSEAHYPSYLRLSDFDFGSDAPDGLKWMSILACNMLNSTAVNSMSANSRLPINDNLHLLLGCTTVAYAEPKIGYQYGSRLTGGVFGIESVKSAWFDSGAWAYALYNVTNSVTFGAIGWPACMGENVYSPNSPDTDDGLLEVNQNVYHP